MFVGAVNWAQQFLLHVSPIALAIRRAETSFERVLPPRSP